MTIIENLNELETNIASAKETLATNISAKGVAVTTANTLTEMATAVSEISQSGGGGDLNARWKEIGYDAEPQYITDGIEYAKEIQANWDASQTDLSNKFKDDKKLVYMPSVDMHTATSLEECFANCSYLTTLPPIYLDNINNTIGTFYNCSSLANIILLGNPANIANRGNMFVNLKPNGTLIYDYRYNYTDLVDYLHTLNPTWTSKTNYEPQECTSLSITADNVEFGKTTTTIHYVAQTNGINILTRERLENVEIKGDATSEDFGENTTSSARQITISYTYLSQTATTTITQDGKTALASVTVDLMGNWELADNSVVPNPNSDIYEGVYQSIHTIERGSGISDIMKIKIVAMPNFELYIRNGGNSTPFDDDELFVGNLDKPITSSDYKEDLFIINKGTSIGSYTKVEYPNDGGEHWIEIKMWTNTPLGGARGYCFFKKPQ